MSRPRSKCGDCKVKRERDKLRDIVRRFVARTCPPAVKRCPGYCADCRIAWAKREAGK